MNSHQSSPSLWGSKRYHSLNHYFRQKYRQKVFKIPLNGGFTCPNRDGTIGTGGCHFCSSLGSGDYAGYANDSIHDQFTKMKAILHASGIREYTLLISRLSPILMHLLTD